MCLDVLDWILKLTGAQNWLYQHELTPQWAKVAWALLHVVYWTIESQLIKRLWTICHLLKAVQRDWWCLSCFYKTPEVASEPAHNWPVNRYLYDRQATADGGMISALCVYVCLCLCVLVLWSEIEASATKHTHSKCGNGFQTNQ